MEKIQVPEGYRCPLCSDHKDEEFEWSNLLRCPICSACSYDMHYGFDFDEQPTEDQYNHSGKVERIIEMTDMSYDECRIAYQREILNALKYRIKDEESLLRLHMTREAHLDRLRDTAKAIEDTIADIRRRLKRRGDLELERWGLMDVPEGYLCPLCGGGHDFCHDPVVETTLCRQCSSRIAHAFEDPLPATEDDASFRRDIRDLTGMKDVEIMLRLLHGHREILLAEREMFTSTEERKPWTEKIREVDAEIAALSATRGSACESVA